MTHARGVAALGAASLAALFVVAAPRASIEMPAPAVGSKTTRGASGAPSRPGPTANRTDGPRGRARLSSPNERVPTPGETALRLARLRAADPGVGELRKILGAWLASGRSDDDVLRLDAAAGDLLARRPDLAGELAATLADLVDARARFRIARQLSGFGADHQVSAVLLDLWDRGAAEARESLLHAFIGATHAGVLDRVRRAYLDTRAPVSLRAGAAYVLAGSYATLDEAGRTEVRQRAFEIATGRASRDADLIADSLEILAAAQLTHAERRALWDRYTEEPDPRLRRLYLRACRGKGGEEIPVSEEKFARAVSAERAARR